ncbi:MAG: hypothetical protein WCB85_08730 [Candidatus Dormiibacterota bacterium]
MRFLETLFRHRLLAIVPIVLGLVVAAGYELCQPREFTSTASVWVDASVPGNGLNNSSDQYVDPSTVEQSEMQQLLSSRSFSLAVGDSGPLAGYLASHPAAEVTGLGAIPGLGSMFSSSARASVSDQIANDLESMIDVESTGPQVVTITVTAPDPAVAAGTAKAFLTEYTAQTVAAQKATDQTSLTYYGQQLSQAQVTLQQAQTALSSFQKANPTVPANGLGNATATELLQAVTLDTTTYQSVLNQYEQAQLNLVDVNAQTGFQVLDSPTANGSPVSISKKLLGAGIAGLVAGLLVSILLISALTAADRSARRSEDVQRLGLQVAASVQDLPRGTLPSAPLVET